MNDRNLGRDKGQPDEQEPDVAHFLQSWAWKREHRPDRTRFKLPYQHDLYVQASGERIRLKIKQEKFAAEGFASTVWDSSIVVAKYFEKIQSKLKGKSCLDLSAGCGLVGIVLARLGAEVVATDLEQNLRLLKENCAINEVPGMEVRTYKWGAEMTLQKDFDIITGCDLMYIEEAVDPLIQSLINLSSKRTEIIMAYGRNRFAENSFLTKCQSTFHIADITSTELDSKYQCTDVRVLRLQRHNN